MADEQPTHLDLFSGIGGFALAARWAGFRTIGFCEIDKYCRRVLAENFSEVLADVSSRNARCGNGQLQSKESDNGQSAQFLSHAGGGSGAAETGNYYARI